MLEKLSFVTEGGPLAKVRLQIRKRLLDFYQFKGTHIISRQTIQYWFDESKNSHPSRQKAFEFLLSFVAEGIDYESLSEDQKKVYAQITSFLRNSLRSLLTEQNSDKVHLSEQSRVIINIPGSFDAINKVSDNLVGIYITYRKRLSEGSRNSIAREVLRIFRRQKDVVFEHWYIKDGLKHEKFEGAVLAVGNLLWLIGAAQDPPERLRVMHFRNVNNTNYRWGVMSSDISVDLSHDPASCRILLCKHSAVGNFAHFVRDNVLYMRPADPSIQSPLVVERLIDNTLTALSNARSITPATLNGGNKITDTILKVNQATLQEAIRILEGNNQDDAAGYAD